MSLEKVSEINEGNLCFLLQTRAVFKHFWTGLMKGYNYSQEGKQTPDFNHVNKISFTKSQAELKPLSCLFP